MVETPFDLVAARLEEMKRMHERELTRQLFEVCAGESIAPVARPVRWRDKWLRVCVYIRTLWAALRGVEMMPSDYWDGY